MQTIQDIRRQFRGLRRRKEIRQGTYEIQNAQFICDDDVIFGKRNQEYIDAEIEWYMNKSLNVQQLFHIYGKKVQIWDQVSSYEGYINSNYGWCVFSEGNGRQYSHVLNELWDNPNSRRAVMIYTRPDMHTTAFQDGMNDFMCTTHVQYFINGNQLDASVYMRSNDAIFGFTNDLAWQQTVLKMLAKDLTHHSRPMKTGKIVWNAGSLHIYERHWDLIK